MTRTLSFLFAAGLFASGAIAQCQTPDAPSFQADHVYYFDHPVPLAPGLNLSIFGNDLGPAGGCQGEHDAQGTYPKSLCDVQVLVGGIASGLLWVQASQINFQVPQETPIHGTADLVVMYRGRSSKVVAMALGVEVPKIEVESPARVGMPVWLKVTFPYNQESGIRYPFMIFPAAFGCNEVEVLRDGMLLPRIADISSQALGGITMHGNPCGGIGFGQEPHLKGRLPLHLRYRFDQPGTYEIRLTMRRNFEDRTSAVNVTKVEMLPADASERKLWLNEKVAHAPTDAADLLSDFLPSILGNPDEETLEILRPYLYHPDRLVREYAAHGLTYWPADQVTPKLWEWMRGSGPSDWGIEFFLHSKDVGTPHARELAEHSIAYLQSSSPVLVHGALIALSRLVLAKDSQASPELRARAGDALIRGLEHAMRVDPENANEYVAALGEVPDARAPELLWELVNRHGAGFGQALIVLAWRKIPADLPKLAQLPLQPANGRALDYEFTDLPYALHNAYGDAAIPYLDTLLERSDSTFVRTNCARELILAKRPKGFAFVADSITNNRSYRQEMVQFVRDQFPEVRESDDAAVLRFVQTRAAN